MKRIRKNLHLPEEIVDEIEKFKRDNFLPSFTSALIELVRRSLKHERNESN